MMELVFFVGIGTAILLLLLLVARDSGVPHGDGGHRAEWQDALATVELGFPSQALAKRIFALEDWEFVSRRAPLSVRRRFVQERKAVAFAWLRDTKNTVGKLMDFHRRTVRRNAALNPLAEVGLGLNYFFFLLVYDFLVALIWALGPFRARTMALYAAERAEQTGYLFGHLLASLGPARLRDIKGSGLGGFTAVR